MTEIRIIGDAVELDGRVVATLIPGLRLSDRDRLEEAFDAFDGGYVADLEDLLERRKTRITQLETIIAQLEARPAARSPSES